MRVVALISGCVWVCSAAGLSVSPAQGRGASRTFTLTDTPPQGRTPARLAMLINSDLSRDRACFALYDLRTKSVSLRNDADTGWAASGIPGTAGVLGNDQCSIDLAQSSFSHDSDIKLKLAVTFQPHFAGAKSVWAQSGSRGWRKLGTWEALPGVNVGGPSWEPIMTPAALPQYFKYDGTEKAEANSSALALPYRFRQPTSPGNDPGMVSGACSFPSGAPDAPPFWFDFSGNRLAGKPKNTLPSEYFVSPVRSGSGLRLVARFGGEAGGSGVLYETAYFHQQYCDAGGLEFGFYRNAVAAQTVFYFSNNSNCGIQPNGYCHVSDSYSSAYQNENNYPGQALTTHVNGWAIQNLNPASKLLYSVFILPDRSAPQGYRFQVEVIDPATSRHADCDAYDTHGYVMFQNKPCSFPVRPGGWYPIDELYNSVSGYVTVGIQRTGNPAVATPADFEVDQVSIPRK